jgi:hypothetical protein
MKLRTTCVALLFLGGMTIGTNAATIVSDDFEGYSSQANFEATWIPSGATGTWTTAQSVSPDHSIGTSAGATQRNDLTFSASTATDIVATDAEPLIWSYQFYDDAANLPPAGNTLGRSYGQLLGRRSSDGALTQLLAMGLWNANSPKASDGVTSTTAELRQYYAARTAFAPGPNWIVLDTGPTRSAGWHELKAVIGSTQVEYLVDGVSAYTTSYDAAGGDVVGWYQARIGSGLSSGTADAYDNYNLVQVPEPATCALIGLGLIGGLGIRRRS